MKASVNITKKKVCALYVYIKIITKQTTNTQYKILSIRNFKYVINNITTYIYLFFFLI